MKTKEIKDAAKEFITTKVSEFINPSPQKVERAKEKVEAIRQQLRNAEEKLKAVQEEWHVFKTETVEKIQANESSIGKFKSKLRTAKDDFKDRYQHEIDVLSEKNIALKKRIGRFKRQSNEKWDKLKTAVIGSVGEVKHAVKDLVNATLE
jgi:hypothetical protein